VTILPQPTGATVSAHGDAKRRIRFRERLQTNSAAIVVATVFALLLGALLLKDPVRVPALTIENPTAYDIRVDVSDANRDGWTVLASARQQCVATVESPVDRGEMWVFRLRAQGLAADEIAVSRSDLERSNWHFVIPAAVAQQWEHGGIPLPPRQSC
jgi:hypothetical protein